MELLLVILALFGALYFAVRVGRSKDRSDAPPASDEQFKPIRISSAGTQKKQPAPFDPKSAKHPPAKQIVQGAAFVIDGDTIRVKKTQIRLFGVDAPEINHPYGKIAKSALYKLCKGHTVRAEIVDKDDHGRTVAHCTLPDGRDLSAEMVKLGLAIDWPKFSGGKYEKLETPDARKKLWLADARQKGRMHVWKKFEANRAKG